MQIPVLPAFLALPFLFAFTGCAANQEIQSPLAEDAVPPPIRLDYIDDRIDDRVRQISFIAGYRKFSDTDIWDRVDAETSAGIEYAHEVKNGLGFELGAMGSLGIKNGVSDNVDVTGAAAELYGGARYMWKRDRWTPYVGGGLSGILAGVDNDQGGQVADDQGFSAGVYLHGGVQYALNEWMYLGVDLRTLFGTSLDLETVEGDADYTQLGFAFGFRL
ncbi:hypothetical protein [Saltatorellus ferox]